MSTPQQVGITPQGQKAACQYTEYDYRGALASINLAAEIIIGGKVPKEREQATSLARLYHSDSLLMKGYRAVLREAFEKPDSFFDPLLTFIQDAMDVMPIRLLGSQDPQLMLVSKEEAQRKAAQSIREGRIERLYQTRQDVEQWVGETVGEVFATLDKHDFFEAMTGQKLAQAAITMRFMYGEILAGLNQYVTPSEKMEHQVVVAFAGTAIRDIRAAMMVETFRRFEEEPRLDAVVSEFATLATAVGQQRLQIRALSARSEFQVLRSKLERFEEDRSQITDCLLASCSWGLFSEYGLAHIEEFSRRHAALEARSAFFVPGQIAFVEVPDSSDDSVIYGAFDRQSGSRCVAASCELEPGRVELGFELSGLGIPEQLAVAARHAAGMRIDDQGKVFPSWAHRLAPLPDIELGKKVVSALHKALQVQERKLAELWSTEPKLLEILSENEATVVIFDGARVFVIGTCLPGNDARRAFFSADKDASAVEYAARAKLDLRNPALWFARVVRTGQVSAPAPTPAAEDMSAAQLREHHRRAFREAVSRTGATNYRGFAASLASWGVVDTPEGHGGHGSLKRIVEGTELRAGTWGKLRDPERNMNFARMYEILDSLRIPVSDYTQWLLRKR